MTRSPAARRWLLPWLALAALAVVRAGVVDERDPYWQTRAGLENLAGSPLLRPDSWSWAPVERVFFQTSPAWNDALGLAWRGAGFTGFFALSLASMLLFTTLVLLLARRLGAHPLPALAAVLGVLLVALPMVSPRATLVAQSLFLAAVLVADRSRAAAARAPVPIVVGTTLVGGFAVAAAGSWVHLSWLLLAPALWLAVGVLALATPALGRGRLVAVLGAAAVGLLAGVLAGPYGTRAWELTRTVQDAASGTVLEWMPPYASGLAARWVPTALLALALAAAGVVSVLRRWPDRGRDARTGLAAALLVLAAPAALGGVLGVRFVGLSLLTVAPLTAVGATRFARRLRERATDPEPSGAFRSPVVRRWSLGRPWRVVGWLTLAVLSPLVLLAGAGLGRPPEAALLDALPRGCRLVSDPASAGPVLLLRPDVRVWTDTRADYWGAARNREALAILSGASTDVPAVQGASCALLSSADLPTGALARALDADPQWERTGSAPGLTAWVRRGDAAGR